MLPDTDERARQELRLRITLGAPLIATEGYATPEVGSVYREARKTTPIGRRPKRASSSRSRSRASSKHCHWSYARP
jgi:hypothetical protein